MSTPDSDPLELAQRLLDESRHAEARAAAEAALAETSASADPLRVGSLQLIVVRASLDIAPATEELARLCRDALNNVRGDKDKNADKETQARLCQLRIALDLGDEASTRDAYAWLTEPRRRLTPEAQAQLIMIEARLAPSPEAATEYMRHAAARLPPGPAQLELRLVLAQLQLHHGQPTEPLDELVDSALAGAESSAIANALESLVWNHYDRLSSKTLDRVIDRARDGAPHVSGYLLAQTDRVDKAVELLRTAALTASEFVRGRCWHALLPLLPNGPERRRCVDELEVLLDRSDDPASRHDLALAQAQLAVSEGDVELLERALANARRAETGVPGPGNQLVVDLLGELIRLRCQTPTPALAELGRELLQRALPLSPSETTPIQLRAATIMTFMGPICHPDVIGAAVALMALADASEQQAIIEARCVWIHQRQSGEPAEPGDWPPGPFDAAPQWLIDLCLGHDRPVTPDELRDGHELLTGAVDARPDVADHLLAALIPAWEAASGPWVEALERNIADGVERPIYASDDAWPKLHAAVEDARRRSSRAWLRGLAATIARARGEAPPEAEAATQANSTGEHLMELFTRARQASEHVRDQGLFADVQQTERARALYREALVAAEQSADVMMLFHLRVGHGNALRWGANPDVEAALAHYREAESLDFDDSEGLAKLWKVWGDALYDRGGADDLREAYRLIARSIEQRTDRLRAESLLSAARVAARHPDFDEETRLRRSIQHMLDATRAGPEIADTIVPVLCRRIAELRRLQPNTHGTDAILDDLQQRYRGHYDAIQQARNGIGQSSDPEIVDILTHMMSDPDCRIAGEATFKLSDPDQRIAQTPPQVLQTISVERLRAVYEANSIRNDPKRLEAELERLRADASEHAATGRLVAVVLVLGRLVQLGQRDESLAREATSAARRALRDHPNPTTRGLLGMQLAELWQADHDLRSARSMSDVDLSLEIAADAVEALGGVDRAPSDLVVLLARGHRYARTGDRNEHLRRARGLYAGLHQRGLAAGDGDTAAIALNHQVDAELELGVGDRRTRLRDGIARLEFARTLAQSPRRIAEIDISIAWHTTQLADFVGSDEQRRLLEQALARFDAVDRSAAPSVDNLEHLRSVCLGSLERLRSGPEAEVAHWEAQVADPALGPYERAIAQHNLAIRLRRLPRTDSTHILRALVLFEDAAKLREPPGGRHAWETCYEAGLMLVEALRSERGLAPELLPCDRAGAVRMAQDWIERALKAAAQLGPGEELVDAAVLLGRLVFEAHTFDVTVELAERAWTALRPAAPYLLFRDELRGWEASFCRTVAARLARLALDEGIVGVGDKVRAINAEAGERATRWLLRAQASARRPTLARIERPASATAAWWSSWQATLDRRDHRELARLLEQIHEGEPDYLTGEPALDETWAWLAAEDDAIAIAVMLERGVAICSVLYLDDHGARRTRVLVVSSATPTGDEAQLIDLVHEAVLGDPAALRIHGQIVDWVRDSIVTPVLAHLGRAPKTVLWCPGPIVRLATPASVWPGVAVACVHSLALPRYRRPKARPRSTLIAAAMKCGESMAEKLEDNVERLLNHAKRSGPARALVSAAELFGSQLRRLKPIRETPASPEDLLAEAPNHDLILVLAHGGAGSEDQAALECVDAQGNRALLTGRHLAAHHDAFADANVILLACSSGRIGGELHTPDGVAGALLAAGARAVIAPLWTISLGMAVHAARALLDGFAKRQRPWQVLPQLPARMIDPGQALDQPSDAERRAGRVVQLQSFVVWLR